VFGRGFTPPREKLNIAGIGIGGQGAGVIRDMATENIVALCDVGGKRPERPRDLPENAPLSDNGIFFVGDKGTLVASRGSNPPALFPDGRRKEFQPPRATIPRSIGRRPEWIKACKNHKTEDAMAGFAYSGPYTEALLVGKLALRLQKRIEWDAANIRASNVSEADELIHKRYRQGFGIGTRGPFAVCFACPCDPHPAERVVLG
jgi:hypothetical protein